MNKTLKRIVTKALLLGTILYMGVNTVAAKADTTVDVNINVDGVSESNNNQYQELSNEIKYCDNYIIYYGYDFSDEIINQLATYDLVVINPLEEDADEAREKLQEMGVLVYGYASSIEIPSYDTDMVDSISEDEKLKVDGQTITHEGNELGDLTLQSYRDIVVDSITERIANKGYDGVFIDTLDDLENIDYILDENNLTVDDIDSYMEDLENAGVSFISEIQEANPNLSIIQNRAFELLDKGSGDLVDGVLYECLSKSEDEDYYNRIKEILDRYTSSDDGVVMALPTEEDDYEESKSICIENNWMLYQTTDYDSTEIEDGIYFRLRLWLYYYGMMNNRNQ